jgi:UDP-N-acetylglucosamine acyltransferase
VEPHGINSEGLKRRGFSSESVMAIKRAYKTLYKAGLRLEEARAAIEAEIGTTPEIVPLAEFLATPGRGIIR